MTLVFESLNNEPTRKQKVMGEKSAVSYILSCVWSCVSFPVQKSRRGIVDVVTKKSIWDVSRGVGGEGGGDGEWLLFA